MREPRLLLNRINCLQALEILSWKFFLLSDNAIVLGHVVEGTFKWLQVVLQLVFRREEHANRTAIFYFNCRTFSAMEKLDAGLTKDLLNNGFACYCLEIHSERSKRNTTKDW